MNKTNMLQNSTYPVMNGGMLPSGFYNKKNTKGGVSVISQGGASAGFVTWMEQDFWAGAHCFVIKIIISSVLDKYLYYILKNQQLALMSVKRGAGIPGLSRRVLSKFKIPIPLSLFKRK